MRILSIVAGGVLLVGLANAAQADMKDDCLQKQNPKLSVTGCTAAIDSGNWQGKQVAWAYVNRGRAYRELREYKLYIEDFDQALQLDPDYVPAYFSRGNAYFNAENYQKAIEDFDQTLRLDPEHAAAYNNRGAVYTRLGERRRAVDDYNEALRLDPTYVSAHYNRGNDLNKLAWALYLEGRNAEALIDADQAVLDRPGYAAVFGTRAHVLAALGRRDEALTAFEHAMELGDENFLSIYQKALAEHGFYRGGITGAYDADFRAALADCLEAGCRVVE